MALAAFVVCPSQAMPPPMPSYTVSDAIALDDGDVLVAHTQGVFRRAAGTAWRRELIEVGREGHLFSGGGALWVESLTGLLRHQGGRWVMVSEGPVSDPLGFALRIQSIDSGGRLWRCMGDGVLKHSTDGKVWVDAPAPEGKRCAQFNRHEHRYAQGAKVVTIPFREGVFQTHDAGQHWSAVPPDAEMAAQGYTPGQSAATSSGHLMRYFYPPEHSTRWPSPALRQWSPGEQHWSSVDLPAAESGAIWRADIHGVAGDRVFVSRWTRQDGWRVVELQPGSGIVAQFAEFGGLGGGVITNRSGVFSFDMYGVRRFDEAKREFEDWPGLPHPFSGAWTPPD